MSKLLRFCLKDETRAAVEYAVSRHGGELVETTCEGTTVYAVRGGKDLQSLCEAAFWFTHCGEKRPKVEYVFDAFERDDELLIFALWRA